MRLARVPNVRSDQGRRLASERGKQADNGTTVVGKEGEAQACLGESIGIVKMAPSRRVDVMGAPDSLDDGNNPFLRSQSRAE